MCLVSTFGGLACSILLVMTEEKFSLLFLQNNFYIRAYSALTTISLNLSTSLEDPRHIAVRWSTAVITTSRIEFPVTPSEVFPPDFSTRRPKGAASKANRSFAGLPSEVGLQKTPCSFVNCWYTSGTKPPE